MARTENAEPESEEAEETEETEESGMDKLRGELSNFLSTQVEKLAEKAGDKLTDVTGQLNDVAENGGSLPAIGSRILQGDSPVKAFVSEKAKGVKDNVVDKAKEAFGGGKGKRKASGGKVMNIIEVLDVGVPLRAAYDHWTQYDQFSSFAKGVRDVSMDEEMSSDWKVKVGPSSRSFKATVQEQIPDERIVWTSEGAKGTTRGAVSFHELAPSLTRIVLVMEYYPSGFFEKTGNLWRAQGRRVRLDFKHFQRYVTLTEEEPEGWRGEIRDGEVVVSHEEAMEEEEAENEEEDGNEEDPEGEEYEEEPEEEDDGEDEDQLTDEDDEEEPEEEEEEEEEEPEEEDEDEDEAPRRRRTTSAKQRSRRARSD
ncbi:SRPBCC family protein [Streptomyces sp. NBC_01022]|uniref:SRPBCC family protein n=1 Tax=Streptomyces sp. NBC_01022 TaxID=2903723 RepID=UPI002DD8CFAF|nr:SRPBCC family protein [Streptomyces sp. NBC_01022]WRZ79236.1 SRPBCC family protein [Streptomyces sp. NBC_01022]WRZ86440.1 SRPBCC family protein [Streptomyces sp. NBC_01022]